MSYTCAIATPHALATAAAEEAVANGGNALDAALAAAATLCVVYPHNTSVGGDLIALVRAPDGRITCVNASGPAPAKADRAALADRHGGLMPITGPDTITVPGAVAGWAALHEEGAALEWRACFEAALRHAAATPVVPGLAEAIADAADLIDADPGMRQVFSPGGRPLAEGDTLRQPALAATLADLAANGPATLYGGPLGRRLSGVLDLADLAAFEVERTAPLTVPSAATTCTPARPTPTAFCCCRPSPPRSRSLGPSTAASPTGPGTWPTPASCRWTSTPCSTRTGGRSPRPRRPSPAGPRATPSPSWPPTATGGRSR